MPTRITVFDRFWEKVDISGPCWLWLGYTKATGYGKLRVGSQWVPAHRWLFEEVHGRVPEGFVFADHEAVMELMSTATGFCARGLAAKV